MSAAGAIEETVSAEEYLAVERASVDQPKCEFVEGIVYAMAGASINHNRIAFNLGTLLGNGLRNRPCEGFGSDIKIHLEATGGFVYPDASALCGPVEPYDSHQDIITNPSFIAEILSPSTEAYDRGKKFSHYKQIATLEEYLLIDQSQKYADLFIRQPDGDWLLHSISGDGGVISLPKLAVDLPLDDLYTNVEFPPPTSPIIQDRR